MKYDVFESNGNKANVNTPTRHSLNSQSRDTVCKNHIGRSASVDTRRIEKDSQGVRWNSIKCSTNVIMYERLITHLVQHAHHPTDSATELLVDGSQHMSSPIWDDGPGKKSVGERGGQHECQVSP